MSGVPSRPPPIFNRIPLSATAGVAFVTILFAVGMFFPAQQEQLTNFLAFFVSKERKINISAETYRYFSYAFLHGDASHLFFNLLWFVIFFVPVCKYCGAARSYVIFFLGVAAGALIFQYLNQNASEIHILIGASAGVSALSGAALRLMLSQDRNFYDEPKPLKLFDFRFLTVSTLMIFVNVLSAALAGRATEPMEIAWQSHIAGYFVGAVALNFCCRK